MVGDYVDFSMFTSEPPYNDVIFQDATQKLQVVPAEEQHYHKYLGGEFLRARQLVDCQAAAGTFQPSYFLALSLALVIYVCNF